MLHRAIRCPRSAPNRRSRPVQRFGHTTRQRGSPPEVRAYTPYPMELAELQATMRELFFRRDAERGVDATFRWLIEEVGELARSLRSEDRENLIAEFGEVLAWTASLANILDADLEWAAARYANGCPKCRATPCACTL
jgi:NTP pyrophosphatase (non-canonical NTP hydrolase)